MSGAETLELLSRYLDDDLSEADRQVFEAGLADDSTLRSELRELRLVVDDLEALRETRAPRALRRQISDLARLEADREGVWVRGRRAIERHVLASPILPGFAVVLALGAILYMLSTGAAWVLEDRTRLVVAPASEPIRELAGRRLESSGSRWVEVGVYGPARRPDPDELASLLRAHPALAELAGLGTVVVRVEGEALELVFGD